MSSRGMFYSKAKVPTREEEMANAREELIFNLTEDLLLIMEDNGFGKAQLAQQSGKTRACCTQLLNGSRNMTLDTFSDVCFALNVKPEIRLTPPAPTITIKKQTDSAQVKSRDDSSIEPSQ